MNVLNDLTQRIIIASLMLVITDSSLPESSAIPTTLVRHKIGIDTRKVLFVRLKQMIAGNPLQSAQCLGWRNSVMKLSKHMDMTWHDHIGEDLEILFLPC